MVLGSTEPAILARSSDAMAAPVGFEEYPITPASSGATVMGRNMVGGQPGSWSRTDPWNGWWGDNPPFHHPVFVLTHHPRMALPREGGTMFNFVTDGIQAALEQAHRAARGKDVA